MLDAVKLAIAALAAALMFSLGYGVRDLTAKAEISKLEQKAAEQASQRARAKTEQYERVLDAERRIAQDQKEALDEAHAQRTAALAVADRNRARNRVLSDEVARLLARSCQPPTAAADPGGAAEAAAAGVHELFGLVGGAAADLAAEADEARAAGLACEQSYDRAREALKRIRLGTPPSD